MEEKEGITVAFWNIIYYNPIVMEKIMIISEKFSERKDDGRVCFCVFRKCDKCGKEEKARFDTVVRSRERRGGNIDFCWSCGNKNRVIPRGREHKNFKNGISASGYKRINVDGKRIYEHRLIMENYLGRKIVSSEQVHHIDLNKQNNDINNLFLFANAKDHHLSHSFMEKCAYFFFNKLIWFNKKNNKYVLNSFIYPKEDLTNFNNEDHILWNSEPIKHSKNKRNNYYIKRKIDGELIEVHIHIAEKKIGRKLYRDECVHHIDGNKHNNYPNNLIVMLKSVHRLCHISLQHCASDLYKQGIVGFNRDIGKYFVVEK